MSIRTLGNRAQGAGRGIGARGAGRGAPPRRQRPPMWPNQSDSRFLATSSSATSESGTPRRRFGWRPDAERANARQGPEDVRNLGGVRRADSLSPGRDASEFEDRLTAPIFAMSNDVSRQGSSPAPTRSSMLEQRFGSVPRHNHRTCLPKDGLVTARRSPSDASTRPPRRTVMTSTSGCGCCPTPNACCTCGG